MPRHISIDLETLATTPDAVILSVGIVMFTEAGIESRAYSVLDLNQPDRVIHNDTLHWWQKQSQQAQDAIWAAPSKVKLLDALLQINSLFDKDTRIWAKGPNFDEVILAHAFRQYNMKTPWHYSKVRCVRTMEDFYPEIREATPKVGTHHNAVDDAEYQANVMINIAKATGRSLP